jgi:hypothetical protein
MITTIAEADDAAQAGQTWVGLYRRGGPALTAGIYADGSYAAGIPVANYYFATPLLSAALNGRDGIDLGPTPAPGMTKYLRRVLLMPPIATGILTFRFVDICLFYPGVDGDGGAQDMVQGAVLTRYRGGDGCRIMVVSQGAGTGVVNALVTYTNSDGVAGRQVTASLNLAAAPGSLCSCNPPGVAYAYPCGPFLPLANGDSGVRSIEAVELLSAGGGISAFVIVKPLLEMGMAEASVAPIEVDLLADRSLKLEQVDEGAYLSAIFHGTTTATPATINGEVETIWG